MEHFILMLTILKTITVIIGAIFLAVVFRAWRKHRTPSMLILFIAILLMTTAVVAEGLAFQALGFTLDEAHVIEGVFMLAAFGVLLYSVLSHKVE